MNLAEQSPWYKMEKPNNQAPAGGSNGKLRRFESVNYNRRCGRFNRQPCRILFQMRSRLWK
jgi:hypothetical protein